MNSYVAIICLSLFTQKDVPKPSTVQMNTCTEIAIEAIKQGFDPVHLVTVGWYESAHIPTAVSSKGAVGPLQILKRYWCPKRGHCDYIKAGVKAWGSYYRQSRGDIENTLCRYHSGKPCSIAPKKTRYYKSRISKSIQKLQKYRERTTTWHERWVNEQCIRCPNCCTTDSEVTENGEDDPEAGDQEYDNLLQACLLKHRFDGTEQEVLANCIAFIEDGDVCTEDNHDKLKEGWTQEQLEKWCEW